MKQIQIGQFDSARLLTYVLSRLVEPHAVEQAAKESASDKTSAEQAQLPRSPTKTAKEILNFAERRWPSRYY